MSDKLNQAVPVALACSLWVACLERPTSIIGFIPSCHAL